MVSPCHILPFNFWIVLQTHPTVNKSTIHSNSIAIDVQTVPCAPGGKTTRGDEHRRGGYEFFTFWIGILVKSLNSSILMYFVFLEEPWDPNCQPIPVIFFRFFIGVFTGYILLTSGGWPFRWFKPTCIWEWFERLASLIFFWPIINCTMNFPFWEVCWVYHICTQHPRAGCCFPTQSKQY